MPEPVVFAGPSAHGLSPALLARWQTAMRPPARRGDIERLVAAQQRPGTIVLADGVFQSVPAVSHAELALALDTGWQVWGVSSLGAIRAYEMRNEGMQGAGWVYRQLCRWPAITDDEMCVLHFPEPPWWPLTEALINVRFALDEHPDARALSAADRRRVIQRLKRLWFGDRTEAAIRQALAADGGLGATAVQRLMGWLPSHRIKCIDLQDLLVAQPWSAKAHRRD